MDEHAGCLNDGEFAANCSLKSRNRRKSRQVRKRPIPCPLLSRHLSHATPMPLDTPCPLVIWRLSDGKPGHEKQTQGLARALLKNRDCVCHTLPAPASLPSLAYWLTGRFPPGRALPSPDIILAAGHATHFALLAARRARGGEAVLQIGRAHV
jgi:hypothetical protein